VTCENESSVINDVAKMLSERGFDGLGSALEVLLNEVMVLERADYLGAQPYQRCARRRGYANGFKAKQFKTRVGELNLSIPQTRDGEFYPSALEKGLRCERALKLALAEMYVQGVSTRKLSHVTEELCGLTLSSMQVSRAAKVLDDELECWRTRALGSYPYVYLDARYEKVRQGGTVVDCAVLIALGVDEHGKRDLLGCSVLLSEAEVHWRTFLQSLVTRGLHGMRLFISDAHEGLKAARVAVFPGVPWQRCQFHLHQNAQSYVPRHDMKSASRTTSRRSSTRPMTRTPAACSRASSRNTRKPRRNLWPRRRRTFRRGSRCSKCRWHISVVCAPPTHPLERINREIKRRTRVASMCPNEKSCERLVCALLMEIAEEWQTGKIYLTM